MRMERPCALLLLLLVGSAGAAPSHFETVSLSVDGNALGVATEDLDGDGLVDLAVVFTQGTGRETRRSLGVFWNEKGSFHPKPDLTVPVAPDTCAYDVANVDAQPGAELLEITPRGVRSRSFSGRTLGKPTPLLEQETFFSVCDPEGLGRFLMAQTLQGGTRVLLVPGRTSLGIYRSAGARPPLLATLRLPIPATFATKGPLGASGVLGSTDPVTATLILPSFTLADADGDGLVDVIAHQGSRIALYRQRPGPGPAFASEPDSQRDFRVETPAELERHNGLITVSVADLDGDGVADFILHKSESEGISSASTTQYLYLGRKGDLPDATPTQVIRREGLGIAEARLAGLGEGGAQTLIVPTAAMGLLPIIRALTSKTLSVSFEFYPFGKDRRFSRAPAFTRALTFRINFDRGSDLQAIDLSNDVNGDGRPDLVFGTGEKELSVFLSGPHGALQEEPAERIRALGYGVLRGAHLTSPARSDLVLFHPRTPGHRGELQLLLNRTAW